jgi:hypothetical protein
MKTCGRVDVWTHIFLTSTLVGGEWSASGPGRFTSGERVTDTHGIGCWVDPEASLHFMVKWKSLILPGLEIWPLGSLCSQSLYRLRYRGFTTWIVMQLNIYANKYTYRLGMKKDCHSFPENRNKGFYEDMHAYIARRHFHYEETKCMYIHSRDRSSLRDKSDPTYFDLLLTRQVRLVLSTLKHKPTVLVTNSTKWLISLYLQKQTDITFVTIACNVTTYYIYIQAF